MKSRGARSFALLAAATMMLAVPVHGTTQAPVTVKKVQRLFHKLRHLPVGATRAGKAAQVLVALARLDPKRAYKYYRIAVTRLDNTGGTAAAVADKLGILVSRIVKKSGLSAAQLKNFIHFGPTDHPGPISYPPTPTPTSRPTP